MPHDFDSYINNKEGTNIKIIYSNFPEIIFYNVFNLSHIHLCCSFPWQFSVFLWVKIHRKPLFPILEVLTSQLTNQISCHYSNLPGCSLVWENREDMKNWEVKWDTLYEADHEF